MPLPVAPWDLTSEKLCMLSWILSKYKTDELNFHITAVVNMSRFILILIFFNTFLCRVGDGDVR